MTAPLSRQSVADAGGWLFPLPAGKKFPPPAGVTGRGGRPYAGSLGSGNVGLRVPDGFCVLDLDDRTLAPELDAEFAGAMVVATPSGGRHYYFADGGRDLGEGWYRDGRRVGDVIRPHHRYTLVPPSDGYHLLAAVPWADLPECPPLDPAPASPRKAPSRRAKAAPAEAPSPLAGIGPELAAEFVEALGRHLAA